MKRRTKGELVIFFIVAAILVINILRGGQSQQSPVQETPVPAVIETVQQTQAETNAPETKAPEVAGTQTQLEVHEDEQYTDKEHVALYLHTYGHLPSNYITKKEAAAAGWDSGEEYLSEVCPGKSIGGDRFGNYEEKLPKKKGRKYFECDIDYGPGKKSRGGKRLVYSSDGLIYYTADHYNNFELLYGEP